MTVRSNARKRKKNQYGQQKKINIKQYTFLHLKNYISVAEENIKTLTTKPILLQMSRI